LSRADKTVTRCFLDIDLDPKTQTPRSIHMTVLTGVKGATGETPKGDKSFEEGIEHVAFHFAYTIDTGAQVPRFEIPKDAAKLMR
jgi:hypothetical protein